jgi:2-polyprenyl-3-methyl-5-hydroxy-6-metoxy-1,4-benzoquinol methylase
VRVVRDDPDHPDQGFAELYEALPLASDLEPWLSLARAARPPILYLGVGTGRLALPLARAGVELVGVDSHPGMLAVLQRRLPNLRAIKSRVEDLDLEERFELVIAPSHLLSDDLRLRRGAELLTPDGKLALELMNPHWLAEIGAPTVRVLELERDRALVEVDYASGHTHVDEVRLIWPEEVEGWLESNALRLVRLSGGDDVAASPTYYIVAKRL